MVLYSLKDYDRHELETSNRPQASTNGWRRWIRSLVTAVLLALPIGAASAEEKKPDPKKIEQVIKLTEEKVKELIVDFDNDKFTVRDAARVLMQSDIDAWYKKEKEEYPYRKYFVDQGWSLEKKRRADALSGRCARHELEHLWTSETLIDIPEAWSTRGPRAGEVLDLIGQQTALRFESYGYERKRRMQLAPIHRKTVPYWELIESIESVSDYPFRFWDNLPHGRRIVDISWANGIRRVQQGPLIANLEIHPSSARLVVMTEPKISWGQVSVRQATITLPDGTQNGVECRVENGFLCTILLPQLQKKTTATLHLQVGIDAYRMKLFKINDPTAAQQFKTRTCSFTYNGPKMMTSKAYSGKTWHNVPFELRSLDHDDEKTWKYYFRIGATDVDPHHCTFFETNKWEAKTLHGIMSYLGHPKDSMLRLPDLPTHRECSFTFPNIPLSHTEKE